MLGFFVLFFNMACKTANQGNEVYGIQANLRFPIVGVDGTAKYMADSIQVYYFHDLTMLQTSYTFIGLLDNGSTQNSRRNRYFIFQKNQRDGQMFESLTDKGIQIPVDSIVPSKMYHVNLSQIRDSFSLVRTTKENQVITNVYSVRYHESSMFDTIRCWYDPKLKASPYVLDSFFNKDHNAQLSRLQIEFNAFNDEQYKRQVERHTIDYQLSNIAHIDTKVDSFIRTYKVVKD